MGGKMGPELSEVPFSQDELSKWVADQLARENGSVLGDGSKKPVAVHAKVYPAHVITGLPSVETVIHVNSGDNSAGRELNTQAMRMTTALRRHKHTSTRYMTKRHPEQFALNEPRQPGGIHWKSPFTSLIIDVGVVISEGDPDDAHMLAEMIYARIEREALRIIKAAKVAAAPIDDGIPPGTFHAGDNANDSACPDQLARDFKEQTFTDRGAARDRASESAHVGNGL